jgi:hypothetical protein
MNCWTVKVHTTLGCTGMWGRETVGWSAVEFWHLGLNYVDVDVGMVILGSHCPDGAIALLGSGTLLRVYQQ